MTPIERLALDFGCATVAPEVLALDIAQAIDPHTDPAQVLADLDAMAALAAVVLADGPQGRAAAQRLLEVVNSRLHFAGNRADYYDPHNSLLHVVLARRTGLPIMLCLVCMAIGRRIGCQVDGLAFPAHFMACYRDAAGVWLLDPFDGVVVECAAAEGHLSQLLGRTVQLPPAAWSPVSAQALALRILQNLRTASLGRRDFTLAGRVLDCLVAVAPGEAQHWRERAQLLHRARRWDEALHDLRRYFALCGVAPNFTLETTIRTRQFPPFPKVTQEDRPLLALYQEAVAIQSRIN